MIAVLALLHKLKYRVLGERLAVCRMVAGAVVPSSALQGEFFCVVRTSEEVSLVCAEDLVPPSGDGLRVEGGWTALKLEGPFPFAMTGVLASVLQPLARASISIFAISTFDTDYVLVKQENVDRARKALGLAGHEEIP